MEKVILLDIEGTIAPISFVKEVLFPYSKERIDSFLKENKDDPQVAQIINQVKEIANVETLEEVAETLKRWIDEDRKITPLKDLQGLIWKEGFETGQLKAPLYPDAYNKMKQWKEKGYPMYIYSSGSVEAQKLFFSHTEKGNILHWFKGFFDTKIGNKKETSSYLKIAQQIGEKPEKFVFFSDNEDEITASAKAGMEVYRVAREGETEFIPDFPYPQIRTFNEVEL
ncbi:MAG: acireductone synthase [Aquificae bacterium]|nr:acireductone synthase [Aquificota bacterium]